MGSAGNGLMAFWSDIDPEYVLRYQQWHNCEHIPERLSIPGFLKGFRYRSFSNAPHFLMFYETRDPGTCASDAYMAALNAPTPWTREALTHFRNPVRNVYSRISVAESEGRGQETQFTAPYLTSLRFDLPEDAANADESAGKWLRAACEAENVRRIRLYCVDAAVGNITTSERKIYSGGPGKQAYLLMIEHSAPPPSPSGTEHTSEAIRRGDAAVGTVTFTRRLNEEGSVYWLEMAYDTDEKA